MDLVILQRDCALCRSVSSLPCWATAFQLGAAVCDQGNLLPGLPAGLFLRRASWTRGVSQDAAWHTQSEGEAAKVMHGLHQPPHPLVIHKLQQCPKQQKKCRTEWRQIQRVFWGLIFFFNLSSQERVVCSCLSLFCNMHADSPMLLRNLFVFLDTLGSLPLSAHLELISLIKEWLYRKKVSKIILQLRNARVGFFSLKINFLSIKLTLSSITPDILS